MDISQLQEKLSMSDLLDMYGQEKIMEYYFGTHVSLTRAFKNPFRKDNTPGCRFYYTPSGKLIFKDYATKSFDCFDIAQLRTGLEGGELFSQIKQDLGQGIPKSYQTNLILTPLEAEKRDTNILCDVIPMTEKDYAYWLQFGITKEVLERFGVERVGTVRINYRVWYLKNDLDVCFKYTNEGKVKLYRPFARKTSKFRNNYTDNILPGYEYLPENGPKLFITKAEKDMMTLTALGAPAVALRSETSTTLPSQKVSSLLQRFPRIYVWLDADKVGREGTDILCERYGFIPIRHDIKYGKDLSDIFKNHGLEQFKKIANSTTR